MFLQTAQTAVKQHLGGGKKCLFLLLHNTAYKGLPHTSEWTISLGFTKKKVSHVVQVLTKTLDPRVLESRRRKPRYNRWLLSIGDTGDTMILGILLFLFFYFCIQNQGHCSCTVLDLLWLHFSFLKDRKVFKWDMAWEMKRENKLLKALGETWVHPGCWEPRLQCFGDTLWSESTPTLRTPGRTNIRVKSQVGSFSPSLLETPSADLAGR